MLNLIQRQAKNSAAAYFHRITASKIVPGVGNIIGWGIGEQGVDA